jgi:hypothetical protein
MTRPSRTRGPAGDRRPVVLLLFLALLTVCVLLGRPVEAGAVGGGRLVAEPILPAAAAGATELYGASPGEAGGEVWGLGLGTNETAHFIRYTDEAGWEAVPDPIGPEGETVVMRGSGAPPQTAAAGRTTPRGGVVTVAEFGAGETAHQELIVRNPGGPFRTVPAPPMEPGESLYLNETHSVVKIAAVEEADGETGAFVGPNPGTGLLTDVFHFDGTEWNPEMICLKTVEVCEEEKPPANAKPQAGFQILAIEAAGPAQAWMLAKSRNSGIVLFKREPEQKMWVRHEFEGFLAAELEKEKPTIGGAKVTIASRTQGQPLTVTSAGVWVDAEVTYQSEHFAATIYYDTGEGDPRQGEGTGSWCDPPETLPEQAGKELCEFPLGSKLPSGEARSFAWAPSDVTVEPYGRRAITGVGQGAMLIFENGAFSRIPLSGGGGTTAGAALSAPDEGWLGPSYHLTREPIPSGLQAWPVPFRRPLLAVAPQPDVPVGELNSQALAVGAEGEIARYLPGVGWQPESLLGANGARATPNLRGVAWPTPDFAYAVGDEGAMWLWRASTGLWESDPASPPNLIRGNFTDIAFDPEDPERGYAVGKQGLLLEYGKRWTQAKLPEGLSPEINITSIAFSGHEAIATWSLAEEQGERIHNTGGLIVNEGSGSGWRTEEAASAALAEVENGLGSIGTTAWRVAGLPDGGAVIVGISGGVIEREVAGVPWHAVPGSLVGFPDAVAAVREGGQMRAVISVSSLKDAEKAQATDSGQAIGQPPAGQAGLLTEPYPLPEAGFLIRQTANGWHDEQRNDYPTSSGSEAILPVPHWSEGPAQPDPILALLLSSDGSQGWVVGGQTGEGALDGGQSFIAEGLQTATAERYGPAATPPANAATSVIPVAPTEATFAIGGGVPCETTCADEVNVGVQPEVWLPAAVGRAASIPGLRGFIYAGAGVSNYLNPANVSPKEFSEEETAYASRLSSNAGGLPVFTTPSPSDRFESSMSAFEAAFAGFPQPLGGGLAEPKVIPYNAGEREAGNYSYAFTSLDESGVNPVRVIVLDESITPSTNLCWLSGQLADAKQEGIPSIVAGDREVGAEAELEEVLVTGSSVGCPQGEPGGASAYFYSQTVDPTGATQTLQGVEGNLVSTLSWGSTSIPTYGSASLGFLGIAEPLIQSQEPASGFLLASINVAGRSTTTNIAPVSVRLIPSIESLAINALGGTLLRRSQTALFEALARRPIAAHGCGGSSGGCGPDPYIQIPSRCVAGHGYRLRPCGVEVQPEYRFTSSRPDIANFVEVDPSSTEAEAVFLDSSGKPVPDPTSGLLCTFNSGTTIVSIETGGLSYSVPVVVQPGSVARPCGTVPRTDLPTERAALETPPPPPIEGGPGFKPGNETPPPPPAPQPIVTPVVPQVIPHVPVPVAHQPVPKPVPRPLAPPFFVNSPTIAPIPVIIPPAPPAAAEPAPPTGTSPVTQPAVSPEPEEEEEAAFDLVHHAMAYLPGDRRPAALQAVGSPAGYRVSNLVPAVLVLIAAIAFTGIAGPRLRRSPEPAFQRNRPQRRPFDEQP